jgi:hypothetical protein
VASSVGLIGVAHSPVAFAPRVFLFLTGLWRVLPIGIVTTVADPVASCATNPMRPYLWREKSRIGRLCSEGHHRQSM